MYIVALDVFFCNHKIPLVSFLFATQKGNLPRNAKQYTSPCHMCGGLSDDAAGTVVKAKEVEFVFHINKYNAQERERERCVFCIATCIEFIADSHAT